MRDKIIKVYANNGALIASFDGDIADTPENQKEKIYNPHISIDEDGSTATFEVYKDSNVWRTISSESEIYEIDGRRYFIYGEPSQISDDNLIRVTLKEIWNELDTKYVQAYNVEGSLEYLAEYTVSLVPFGAFPLVVNGATKTNPFARDNLGYYIWALLQDTGYSISYCDVVDDTYDEVNLLSAYQLETEGLTVLENLKQLKELTDCLFKWNTVNKTLAVYDRNLANSEQNKWQGYEIREGVNLKSIEKRKNTNITTRVIPYGSDNLTIASVNSGLLYLSDTSYSNKIYTKIINNPDIESPQALKCWAEKELAKMCRPTVEYEVDFVKRSDGEYAVETFNLYDIVRIVYFDKELGQEVIDNQRIISLNYDVWKNSAFVAKLGDKTLRWEQKLKQSIENGKKSGQVISSSGIVSTGNIFHGTGTDKQRLNKVVEGVYTSIAEIDAKADENEAYVNLLALYANDTQGIKSAPTDTDKTLWDILYTYYAVNSQKFYKYNSTITIPDWEETKPLSSSISSISAKADANESSISSLTTWSNELSIGGRNLLKNSDVSATGTSYSLRIYDWANISDIVQGTEYTVTIEGILSEEQTGWYLNVQTDNPVTYPTLIYISNEHKVSDNKWVGTFIMPSLEEGQWFTGQSTLYALPFNEQHALPATVTRIKIEKGNMATDWTPAPEDVDGAINAVVWSVAQIQQQANENGAKIDIVAQYTSGAKGIVETDTYPPANWSDWDTEYVYYVNQGVNQGYYKYTTDGIVSWWELTDTVVDSVASIKTQANENGAKIGLIAEYSNTKGVKEVSTYTPANWDKTYVYYLNVGDYRKGYYRYNTSVMPNAWEKADDIIGSIAKIELKADKNGSRLDLIADEVNVFGTFKVEAKESLDGLSTGSTIIDGACIKTGIIQSETYADGSGYYSSDGMQISLDGKGYIRSKNFAIDGSGNAYFKGNIEASGGTIANWNIFPGAILSGASGDPNDATAFFINSYSSSSPNWIEAHNFDGVKTFSISKNGVAEILSGYIGSNPISRWHIGSNSLYKGLNSLEDENDSPVEGIYIGTDGISNQKVIQAIDMGVSVTNTKYIRFSEGQLYTNKTEWEEGYHYSYSSIIDGQNIILSTRNVGSLSSFDFKITNYGEWGTIISQDGTDKIRIRNSYPFTSVLYQNWDVDGALRVKAGTSSFYDVATELTSLRSRVSDIESYLGI